MLTTIATGWKQTDKYAVCVGVGKLTNLIASITKVDACRVSTPGTIVAVDEAHVGWGHLQHWISPHMLILGAACTPTTGLTPVLTMSSV